MDGLLRHPDFQESVILGKWPMPTRPTSSARRLSGRNAMRARVGIAVADARWGPLSAPLRNTERFKVYARKAGLVDYWKQKGWPDLCRPVGADDFVCN